MTNASNFMRGFTPASNPRRGNNIYYGGVNNSPHFLKSCTKYLVYMMFGNDSE